MKRHRIELTAIAAWDNLLLAVLKAAKGKRFRPAVTSFFMNLDESITQLHNDILEQKVPDGNYRSFVIHDPKRRTIHAASFTDRVLHHAIMNCAAPIFENSLVGTSFACRPGKGIHLAVVQVQRNLQRFPWFVQVDVEHYFPAIDHARLLNLLSRRFKDVAFMQLLERIIRSYQSTHGKGLPIGSLTSQYFANYYLDSTDRFLLNHPAVCAHIRYMDDIVWWCENNSDARIVLQELTAYVRNVCQLKLKPLIQINRSTQGITYCGFRIFPGTLRLTARKQRRYRYLRQHYEATWKLGFIDDQSLQTTYDAILAATLPAHSKTWRQRDLQLHPCLYDNGNG
ncbi:Reverse transcriptase (RNA-dependent DNA polymerase) [Nitrosomonas ureae]|uniref:Reverse transcriptase (RNA-dependent DNA polymerase) n=1 Tax=Nitrosomonas ureae TaxID=44577 RepID=A0A285BXJ5_9PROT|nr:reverse transcriptase/maturase family protein [Nitrosomonas ureae]SNX59646.1 Reverse transcriptase (RNA-dependent DNA polymerase) [Nitrosomonas ureae]